MTLAEPQNKNLQALSLQVRKNLKNPAIDFWEGIAAQAGQHLSDAKALGDEDTANGAWFVQAVALAKAKFLGAFDLAKSGEYFEAWRALEQIEIALIGIRENPFFDLEQFGISEFRDLIENWQRLYPYKVFFSPEFVIKDSECSICGGKVTPWKDCGHRVWKVYAGEMCSRRVTKAEIPSISLVLNPVQKYSVVFMKGGDHYDYGAVAHIVQWASSPFDRFAARRGTARHPHKLFKENSPTDPCPCGSGQTYQSCCLAESGVVQPHLYIQPVD